MKAEEIASKNDGCDSLMLRNTYSNLHYLFYNVQDYQNARLYAEREYDMTERLGLDALRSLTHLGQRLRHLTVWNSRTACTKRRWLLWRRTPRNNMRRNCCIRCCLTSSI